MCVFLPTHQQVPHEVQGVVADDGYSVQGGDGQVLPPQQLLQQPDKSTEDAEVGCSAVGHQLVVTLRTNMNPHRLGSSVKQQMGKHCSDWIKCTFMCFYSNSKNVNLRNNITVSS